ncbi:hypothetical protein J6590_043275 [Homalodisca vitripennis]|nr:hypothetical protein J6590_043275 [Homalodisca vitripennis]
MFSLCSRPLTSRFSPIPTHASPTARHGALRLQRGTSSATSLTPHWLLQGHAPNRLLPQLHSLAIPTVGRHLICFPEAPVDLDFSQSQPTNQNAILLD